MGQSQGCSGGVVWHDNPDIGPQVLFHLPAVLSQDLAEQEMGDLRETQAHLTTQLVATQGRVEKRLTHWMRNSSLDRRKLELDFEQSWLLKNCNQF